MTDMIEDIMGRLKSMNPCNAKADIVARARKTISEKPKFVWDSGTKQWFCFGEWVGHGCSIKDAYVNYLEDGVRVLSRQKKYWYDFAEAYSRTKQKWS